MSQPSKMFIARETLHKSWQYQISRHQFFQFSNILKSYTPFYFTYISAPKNRTEKFLYSRRSYGSHLSNELCPRLLAYLQPEKLSKNCGAFFSGHPVAQLGLSLAQVSSSLFSYFCQTLAFDALKMIRKKSLLVYVLMNRLD